MITSVAQNLQSKLQEIIAQRSAIRKHFENLTRLTREEVQNVETLWTAISPELKKLEEA